MQLSTQDPDDCRASGAPRGSGQRMVTIATLACVRSESEKCDWRWGRGGKILLSVYTASIDISCFCIMGNSLSDLWPERKGRKKERERDGEGGDTEKLRDRWRREGKEGEKKCLRECGRTTRAQSH